MKKRIKFLIFCFPFLCIFSLHAQNIIASNDSTLDLVGVWASGATYAVEMENGVSYCGVGHYFKMFDFGRSRLGSDPKPTTKILIDPAYSLL